MIKVGIIGAAGRIGSQMEEDPLRLKPASHIGAFTGNSECKVLAVCDLDFEATRQVAEKWNVNGVHVTVESMMRVHSPLDIVSICTPTETHARILYEVAEYKPKLIFCEKPLAHNIDAAAEMVKVCERKGVILAVNHTRRWDPIYQRAKERCLPHIGQIIRIMGIASREKDFPGNIHMFDLLNWFSEGDWSICTYVDCNPSEYLIFEVDILGSEGRVRIMDNGRVFQHFESMQSSHYEGINELGNIEQLYPKHFPAKPLERAVMNLVNCIEPEGPPWVPLCTGWDGLDALRMYDAFSGGLSGNLRYTGEIE